MSAFARDLTDYAALHQTMGRQADNSTFRIDGGVARGEIGAGGEQRRRAARVRPAAFLVRTGKLVQDSFGGGLLTGRVDSSSLAVLASCGLGAALVRDRPYRRMAQQSTWSVSGRRCRAI